MYVELHMLTLAYSLLHNKHMHDNENSKKINNKCHIRSHLPTKTPFCSTLIAISYTLNPKPIALNIDDLSLGVKDYETFNLTRLVGPK